MTTYAPTISLQEIEHLDRARQTLTLSDNRKLAFNLYGVEDGKPMFYFHGGPSSRLEGALLHHTAIERGYRVICPDRPGHGYSDMKVGYQIVDLAKDVQELAQYLKLDRFGVMGTSGGGPPVIACAYALPISWILPCSAAGLRQSTVTQRPQKNSVPPTVSWPVLENVGRAGCL